MLGDNIYEGPATPEDYRRKFEEPYGALLDDGVKFYAVLGNHDDPRQVHYPPFNMDGERYYSFAPPEDLLAQIADAGGVLRARFDQSRSRPASLARRAAGGVDARTGRWRSSTIRSTRPAATASRRALSACGSNRSSSRHGVDVVFSGHEHIYQRSALQGGVQYFISGGAGSLRPGDGAPASFVARTFDDDYHFMLIEIDGDELHFQAISRTGETIDAGVLFKDGEAAADAADEAITPRDTAVRR